MKIRKTMEIEPQAVEADGASGAQIRWVISRADGAPNFAMRIFDIQPGGHTPGHSHDWEHEIYVIEGEITGIDGDGEHALVAGDAVFVPGGEHHQFRNDGGAVARMMCLVPNMDD